MKRLLSLYIIVISLSFTAVNTAGAAAPEWLGNTYGTVLSEDWMNVKFGGQKMGFSYSKIEQGDHGYRIISRAVVRLEIMGAMQDMSFSRSYYLDKNRNVIGFISLMKTMNQRQQTVGVIENGSVHMKITGAGGTSSVTKKISPGVQFAETMGFAIADKLKVGFKATIPVFIVELRANNTMDIEIVGQKTIQVDNKPTQVFVANITLQGFKSKSYITSNGVIVREEQSLMGIVSEKTDGDNAISFPASGSVPISSLITFSLIKPDKSLPGHSSIRELKLDITGIKNPASLPGDERQVKGSPEWIKDLAGKRRLVIPLTIKRKQPGKSVPISKAYKGDSGSVAPTPEIQSENKMIKREAKKIVGDEKDAWEAAKKINRWVFSNVKKKLVDSFTAVDTLLAMEGECQSHTNLFAALGRSVGLPVKVASGIVYSSENEGFLYHAWPEVYVGEWVAMDPTLGQDVADATHIKLAEGGVESQLQLVRFIGKLNITINSYSK